MAPGWICSAAAFRAAIFDVGIAEQHAVTFSAGLAAGGMKPFCATVFHLLAARL